MILINEVAQKLQDILNGVDTETQSIERPVDYLFNFITPGFHLDSIAND